MASASTIDAAPVIARVAAANVTFKNKHDAVAFAMHCAMLDRGFLLQSLTDAPASSAASTAPASASSTSTAAAAPAPAAAPAAASASASASGEAKSSSIGAEWNASDDGYCFVYSHPGLAASATVCLKALRMEQQLLAHAAVSGDSASVHSLELNVDDYVVSAATFPRSSSSALYRNADRLITLFEANIRSKVAPAAPAVPSSGGSDAKAPLGGVRDPRDYRDDPLRDPRFQPRRPGPLEDDPFSSPLYAGPRPGGDFAGDLNPFGGGGGNLLGPGAFAPDGGLRMPGGRGGGGMRPRYDPVGPGGADPDFDDLRPPGGPGAPGRGLPGFGGGPRFGGGFGGGGFGGGGFI